MRLKEYICDEFTIKYAKQSSKSENPPKHMLVALTNPAEKDGMVEFVFNLVSVDVPKLFIASAADEQFGSHLIKDCKPIIRDAIIELIEEYRIENCIEKCDVYCIGFCLSSYPALAIAVENGYNAMITELNYKGNSIIEMWDDADPEKQKFIQHRIAVREKFMSFTFEYYYKKRAEYTGYKNFNEYIAKYLEQMHKDNPTKLKVPKIYFFSGKYEECYRFSGEKTIESLRKLGINIDFTLSEERFGHMEAIPYFTKFMLDKMAELGFPFKSKA